MLKNYDISLVRGNERKQLQEFIDEHWKKNHVLAISRELLDWQHYNRENDIYTFVVARHKRSKEFHAVLGYIPTSQFDSALSNRNDVWPVIWKARKDIGASGLGMLVYYYSLKHLRPRTYTSFGMNPGLAPLIRAIGARIGSLEHYFMANESVDEFEILGEFDGKHTSESGFQDQNKSLVRCEIPPNDLQARFRFSQPANWAPSKSLRYLENRYFRHPIYDYQLYEVQVGSKTEAILVLRAVSHRGKTVLRVVDYFGRESSLAGTKDSLQNLLRDTEAEYLDFYHFGLDGKSLMQAGFQKRSEDSATIVPNYFEPYEKRNIRLDFVLYSDVSPYRYTFVKGDCDQDRPSILSSEENPGA